MIINFEHRNASHCETGVSSNLLNFYGFQLSEPMVLGIGSGLFFTYLPFLKDHTDMPMISFRTIPGTIFTKAMKRINIKVGIKRFYDKERAMKEMDELLAAETPVGIVVGMHYLPYVPREVRTHFNAHNICIVGKEGDEYTVSDPLPPPGLQKISYNDLKRVRFAQGMFKPRGKMYWVKEKPTALPDLRSAIEKGINTTCRNMVGIPLTKNLGARSIALLSKHIRTLETKRGEKGATLFLAKLIQLLEEFGTGGGGFRFMYGVFLHEAADILNKPKLKDFAVEMNNIGDLWRQFAIESGRKLKNRSSISYNDLADKLMEIATAEKKFFTALRKGEWKK